MGFFKRNKKEAYWTNDGWNVLQEPNAEKHILGISCLTEAGKVVEVRTCHNDGEETVVKVTVNGENILPISIQEFTELYADEKIRLN